MRKPKNWRDYSLCERIAMGYEFSDTDTDTEAEEEFVDDNGNLFGCTHCGMRYNDSTLARYHKRLRNAYWNRECPTEEKVMEVYLREKWKPQKCPSCPKRFRFKVDLKRHIDESPSCRQNPQKCPTCAKQFRFKVDVKRHIAGNPSCKPPRKAYTWKRPSHEVEGMADVDRHSQGHKRKRGEDGTSSSTHCSKRCRYCGDKYRTDQREAHMEHCDVVNERIRDIEAAILFDERFWRAIHGLRDPLPAEADDSLQSLGQVRFAPPSREVKMLLLKLQVDKPELRPKILASDEELLGFFKQ